MKKNLFYFLLAGFICGTLAMTIISSPVSAHYASITVDNYHPATGDEIMVNIGFGHTFPNNGEMRREAYDHTNLQIVSPTGKTSMVPIKSKEKNGNYPIRISLKESGPHTLILTQKNYSSKTTKGYKYQPKDKLTNVLHSRWSETVSKALVTVKGKTETANAQMPTEADTNNRFKITPLKDPGELSVNQFLPVKVTLDGKPWRGTLYATYAGFSDKSDTFAYTTRTDKQGKAEIKILQDGIWLVKADHAYPYENKNKADEYSLKATLTFEH